MTPRARVHVAGPVEQGWRVITVWESSEAFHRFREEKLLFELGEGRVRRVRTFRSTTEALEAAGLRE